MDTEFLAKVELFHGLPEDCLAAIASLAHMQSVSEGAKVFSEGDPGDTLFIVQKGSVRISQQVPGAGEEALTILREGAYFGEMALIDEQPRSADVIANEDVVLVAIGRNELHSMLRADKNLAYHILLQFTRNLAKRLRATNDRIKSFLAASMWS